jgi:hypothetical protein
MHYVRHYEKFIECDFCGQQTRGRVYDDEPEKVYCGACNNVMIEKGTNNEKSANHIRSSRNWKDHDPTKDS